MLRLNIGLGMYDKAGTMCLIDPQSHLCVAMSYCFSILTYNNDSSELSQMNRVYWDGGPQVIEHFMGHHLKECSTNVICNALHLRTVEFEDSNESEPRPILHFKSPSPRKYLTRSQKSSDRAEQTKKVNPL